MPGAMKAEDVLERLRNITPWTALIHRHDSGVIGCDPCALAILNDFADAVREEDAMALEREAELVKHTSHCDGLGMGWQALEQRLAEVAAAIRARKAKP